MSSSQKVVDVSAVTQARARTGWYVSAARRVRFEMRKGVIRRVLHFMAAGHAVRAMRVRKFLVGNHAHYLQVGGGVHIKTGGSWLNGDILHGDIYLNAAKRLPFPDNSLDAIFTEHFIEHLPQEDAVLFTREAFRVLRPGGVLRQATPDLEKLVLLYQDKNDAVSLAIAVARHMRNHRANSWYAQPTGCQFLNDVFRLWGHQYIYDRAAFLELVRGAGFVDLRWASFGNSETEFLRNLERHADEEWMKDGITMILEACKPRNGLR